MPDRILTSHAGSLPRPESLISLNELRAAGEFTEDGHPCSVARIARSRGRHDDASGQDRFCVLSRYLVRARRLHPARPHELAGWVSRAPLGRWAAR